MNAVIFWRVVWKEYRQQRALWYAIAAAGVIMQAGVIAYCALNEVGGLNGVVDLADRLFTVALSVPVLYSLGCGATLFAGEHEAETYSFQQSLPVEAGRVFSGKLAFALVSALALFPALWFVAWALSSWQLPDPSWHLKLWAGGCLATVEVMIWAVLASLVLRRVLPAAIVSGLIAVLLGYSSLVLVMLFGKLFQQSVDEYFSTLPFRSLCALLALAVAVKLGRQWFTERPKLFASAEPAGQADVAGSCRASTSGMVLQRLIWHQWRQSRVTLFWLVLGYFSLVIWFGFFLQPSGRAQWEVAFAMLPVLATAVGASLFWADQQGQSYHFFGEHGVRPRMVWLSRQLVGGLIVTVAAGIASAPLLAGWRSGDVHLPGAAVGLAIVMFACGQACSIFIRSGIVAIFTAILCSIVLLFWTVGLHTIGVWWVVSTLPLPLIFWWATWLYAPQWVQQRTSWRVRIAAAATIFVPLAAVVVSVFANRVYEIPAVELSFTPPAAGTRTAVSPEARETAGKYAEAMRLLRNGLGTDESGESTIRERNDQWGRGIELFVTASQRPTCHFPNWLDLSNEGFFDGRALTQACLLEARQLTAEGDLAGAADLYDAMLRLAAHYYQQPSSHTYILHAQAIEGIVFAELPKWAAGDNQSRADVLQMLERVRKHSENNQPDWKKGTLELYALERGFLDLDDEVLASYFGIDARQARLVKVLSWLLPWEWARASRVLDLQTESEWQRLDDESALPPSRLWPQPVYRAEVTLSRPDGRRFVVTEDEVLGWLRTTRLQHLGIGSSFRRTNDNIELHRRAVQVQLAAIAWWMEHDELPSTLQELVGDGLGQLPVDPHTGQPFVFVREGVEEEVWDEEAMGPEGAGMSMGSMETMGEGMSAMGGSGMSSMGGMMEVPTKLVRTDPFLWSPGEMLYYMPGNNRGSTASPVASDFRAVPSSFRTNLGAYNQYNLPGNQLQGDKDLLQHGLRFLIPKPAVLLRRDEPSVE